MAGRLVEVLGAARDPVLRRVEISVAGFAVAEHATWLAVLVYAFDRGGVREAGVVAIVMLLAAVALAPFAAYAGDRFRPGLALSFGYAAQSVTMAATAAAMWLDLPAVAYLAAVVVAATVSFTRPVLGALLPTIARRPAELVAANVVIQLISDIGMFIGPLAAAVLLAVSTPATVLAVFAVVLAGGAALTFGFRSDESTTPLSGMNVHTLGREVLAGITTLRHERSITALIAVMAIGALTAGVVDVLSVTFADLRLDAGGSQAGILAAGAGLGAIVGSSLGATLIGGSRLIPFLGASALMLGVPFAILAGVGQLAVATVLFGLVGMGQSVLSITGTVAIQRRAPSRVLARVLGVLESFQMLSMAIGAALVTTLVDVTGLRTALILIGIGVIVALVGAITWFVLIGGDAPAPSGVVVDRLLADPVFRPLDHRVLDRLATGATAMKFSAGEAILVEGDAGDRYYLLVSGEADVTRQGHPLRRVGAGDSFGEIALLQDVPRTASVTACGEVEVLAVERDDFLEAVTGHPRSLSVATEVARDRASRDPEHPTG